MAGSPLVLFLIAGMLITGCAISLLLKWQDRMCVENCESGSSRPPVHFEQPGFFPVLCRWLFTRSSPPQLPTTSEADELAASAKAQPTSPLSGWKLLYFWLPAFCDLAGTTLINVGLLHTPVSIYQMTRAALVLWVGLLSVFFLNHRLYFYQWIALFMVMAGVILVGLSGTLINNVIGEDVGETIHSSTRSVSRPIAPQDHEPTSVFVGVIFVLFAQFFTATQFILEEKIMKGYTIDPLLALGLEGLFGALSILLCMPILAPFASTSPFFDFPRGWHQIVDHSNVLLAAVLIMCSIALFSFFGLSMTFRVGATARSTTDSCRTFGVWIISLGLGWEHLAWPYSLLQLVGFALLVYGTILFNNLIEPPAFIRMTPHEPAIDDELQPLLTEQHPNKSAALRADACPEGV